MDRDVLARSRPVRCGANGDVLTLADRLLELRMAAKHVGVDPDDAVAAAVDLVQSRPDEVREGVADALVEQLLAGIGLEGALSALREAGPDA